MEYSLTVIYGLEGVLPQAPHRPKASSDYNLNKKYLSYNDHHLNMNYSILNDLNIIKP